MAKKKEQALEYRTKLGISGILECGGKILLGLRGPGETMSNLWCTPGGGVEPGERMDQALVREFMEETGLTVTVSWDSRFVSAQEKIDHVQRTHTMILFKRVSMALDGPLFPALKPNPEFIQLRWFTQEEIFRMPECLTHATLCALTDYLTCQACQER